MVLMMQEYHHTTKMSRIFLQGSAQLHYFQTDFTPMMPDIEYWEKNYTE